MSEHFIQVCSCGEVIAQCRCPGDKAREVVQEGCPQCVAKKQGFKTYPIKLKRSKESLLQEAAPDLLAACRSLLFAHDDEGQPVDCDIVKALAAARSAVAKAEGLAGANKRE